MQPNYDNLYIYSKGKSDNNIFYTSTFIKKVCSIFIIYMKNLTEMYKCTQYIVPYVISVHEIDLFIM